MHSLVTFLGKGRDDPKTGYRTACYRFPDGGEVTTAFFGRALAEYLKPDELIVIGTSGSMWGVFVENLPLDDREEEEARLELFDAEGRSAVTQALLDRLAPLMSRAVGRRVKPLLVPYGRTTQEQQDILRRLGEAVSGGEVSFDLTHGFRFLSMLGLLSAFTLERAGRLGLRGLWYGALEMTEHKATPVLPLDGLIAVQRWVDAFVRFEASGDYGVFAPLLEADGLSTDKAQCLVRAAHFERISHVVAAAKQLKTFLRSVEGFTPAGASALFLERLKKHLRWALADDLAEQQRLLALQALRRGDCLRAAILGIESLITRRTREAGGDRLDYSDRQKTDEEFQRELKAGEHADWKRKAYWLLKNLRNAMAHGIPPEIDEYRKLLNNPERLARELEATLNRLTNT